MTLTRRSLLGLVGVAALGAGCRARGHRMPPGSADRAAVDEAMAAERLLLERYAVAIAQLDAVAAGPLTRARDRHLEHLHALAATPPASGVSPAATPSPAPSAAPSAALAGTLAGELSAGVAPLQAAAIRARSGPIAALLASIAAEHAADSVAQA